VIYLDNTLLEGGLELNDAKLVLEHLTILHAGSYHYIRNNPGGVVDKFKECLPMFVCDSWTTSSTEEGRNGQDAMFLFFYDATNCAVQTYSEDKELKTKVDAFRDKMLPALLSAIKTDENQINCLVHSDGWTNNFMFR
jgi:hypothetical protein